MLNAMTLETSSEWDQPAIDTKFIQRALRPVRSRSFHSNSNLPTEQSLEANMVYRYAVPCQDWCLQTIPIEGEQPPKCNPSDSSWGTVFAQALRSGLVVKASGCLKSRCTIPCPSQFRDTKLRAQGENFLACRHCYDPDLQSALGTCVPCTYRCAWPLLPPVDTT